MLTRRIAAALAVGHGGHGRHSCSGQALDHLPFLRSAEHRRLGTEKVLDDLAPANTAVNLDEVTTPVDFGAQGTAAFQLSVDLTLQRLDGLEGVATGPQALERLGENQLHACFSARITSAAFFGIEYRSALPA